MSYYIFQTEQEAAAAEAQIVANIRWWAQENAPEVVSPDGYLRGRNAATGELSIAVTMRWDAPRPLPDGRFAILAPTSELVAPMPLDNALIGIAARSEPLPEPTPDEQRNDWPVSSYSFTEASGEALNILATP